MLMQFGHKSHIGMTVFLSLFVFSVISIPLLTEVDAQVAKIDVNSMSFDKTTIMEFKNKSDKSISEIRVWLSDGVKFDSFKSEDGWRGNENSAGVIIFTTSTPVKPDETVKIGIKTDSVKPNIIWKVVDTNKERIETGISESTDFKGVNLPEEDLQVIIVGPAPKAEEPKKEDGIFSMSSFRLVPDDPKVGDSVRVIGSSFAGNEKLDFYIDGKRITDIQTNIKGNFLITEKIPGDVKPSSIDFEVKDVNGNVKKINLRISEEENRMTPPETILLAMEGLPDVLHRGDIVNITGTATPGSTITAKIMEPTGSIITSEPRPVNSDGRWSFESIIPLDTPFGIYEAIITDGIKSITKSWKVESSKIIEMSPTSQRFERGEEIKFSGTAIADEPIEFILENPHGMEIFSEVKTVDSSGNIEFTYKTVSSAPEGTYILFAKQRDSTEILLTGLGQLPGEHVVIKMNKVNYKKSDIAIVNINGPASSKLSLSVIDQTDDEKFRDNNVILGPSGKLAYELDLKDYSSEVYTLILKRANTVSDELFSVGLQFGAGQIDIKTVGDTFKTNDPVMIIGKTNPNVIVTLELIDSQGTIVKSKETFTDRGGKIVEGSFRIPADGMDGTWMIKAKSGTNFETIDLNVVAAIQEGMIIVIEDETNQATVGDLINFKILGAKDKTPINVTIKDDKGDIIMELTPFTPTSAGERDLPWRVPNDFPPGQYTISAKNARDMASATFTVK